VIGELDIATTPQLNLELELQRTVEAPAMARRVVSNACNGLDLSGSEQQTLMLLVSELVSNAVLHSSGPTDAPLLLAATAGENVVRIAVTDAGRGFTPGPRDQRTGRGYGLYLLDRAASRWGSDRAGGTRVWFELALTA
jgi:anti-sigma regulatory factor (Ser/Thr protein kinase)